MPKETKRYLGDSVYVDIETHDHCPRIYTNNGFGKDNIIYLDQEVMSALKSWITDMEKEGLL